MGFLDRRMKKLERPDRLWGFLRHFAERGGRIAWDDPEERRICTPDQAKDWSSDLRERLHAVFPNVSGNPIVYDKEDLSYKTVFCVRYI
jgi:hypothetical protein